MLRGAQQQGSVSSQIKSSSDAYLRGWVCAFLFGWVFLEGGGWALGHESRLMHKAVARHHTFYRFVSSSSRLLLPLPPSPLHHTAKTHLLLRCVSRSDKHHFSASVPLTAFPLTRLSLHPWCLDNRSHPAGSGSMGEVDAGPVHLPDSGQLHQRPVCPHWHRNRHHCLWPVWVLCHLPGEPMDAEAGERPREASLQDRGILNHVIYGWCTSECKCVSCLPAVCHVSLPRLPRWVSGWYLRICISSWGQNALHNWTSSARRQCPVKGSLGDHVCFCAAD